MFLGLACGMFGLAWSLWPCCQDVLEIRWVLWLQFLMLGMNGSPAGVKPLLGVVSEMPCTVECDCVFE